MTTTSQLWIPYGNLSRSEKACLSVKTKLEVLSQQTLIDLLWIKLQDLTAHAVLDQGEAKALDQLSIVQGLTVTQVEDIPDSLLNSQQAITLLSKIDYPNHGIKDDNVTQLSKEQSLIDVLEILANQD